jgi:hypothetical protein
VRPRSNVYISDLEDLIGVCKAMPGFSQRSQDLSAYARQAIVRAFVKSGQKAPSVAQRYIEIGPRAMPIVQRYNDHPGRVEDLSPDQRDLSAESCVANHETPSSHPIYQEVDGRQGELHTPATFTMPNSTAGTQQMQYTHASHGLDNPGRSLVQTSGNVMDSMLPSGSCAQTPVDATPSQARTEYHVAPQLDALADVAAAASAASAASAQPSQSSQHVPPYSLLTGTSQVQLNDGHVEAQYVGSPRSGLTTNDGEACDEQSLQAQCRLYVEQSYPQQTTAHRVPLNGANNLSSSRFDQGRMAISNHRLPLAAGQVASRALASVFTPDYRVYDDHAVTGQIRTPAQQHIVNSHEVQHSWQQDADLWMQGTSAPQARFDSAMGPPLDQSGQDGGPTGGTMADSTDATDWGWNYGTWLNDQL